MLELGLVEDLPIRNLEVEVGDVPLSLPVREAALGIPAHEARVVVGEILQAAFAQVLALGVIPRHLVGGGWIGHRLIGLEKPRGNGAEVKNGGVAFGRVEEIDGRSEEHTSELLSLR